MSKSSAIAPKEQNPIEALAVLETAKKLGTEVRVDQGNLRFATVWERFVSAISSIPKLFQRLQHEGPPAWEAKAKSALANKFAPHGSGHQPSEYENPVYLTCISDVSDETSRSNLENYMAQINNDRQLRQQTKKFYVEINTGDENSGTAVLDSLKANARFDQITSMTASLMGKGYSYKDALSIARGASYLTQKYSATDDQALEVHRIIFLLNSENLTNKKLSGTALLDYGWTIFQEFKGRKKSDSAIIRSERAKLKQATKKQPTLKPYAPSNDSGIFQQSSNVIKNYSLETLKSLLPEKIKFSEEKNTFLFQEKLTEQGQRDFIDLMKKTPRSQETQFIDPETNEKHASSMRIGDSIIELTDLSSAFVSDSSRETIKIINQKTGEISEIRHQAPLEFAKKLSELTGISSKAGLISLCDFFSQDFSLNLLDTFSDTKQSKNGGPFLHSRNYPDEESKNSGNTTQHSTLQKDEKTLTITPDGKFVLNLNYLQKINQVIDAGTTLLYPVNQSATMQGPVDENNAGLTIQGEIAVNAEALAKGTLDCAFTRPPQLMLQIAPAGNPPKST